MTINVKHEMKNGIVNDLIKTIFDVLWSQDLMNIVINPIIKDKLRIVLIGALFSFSIISIWKCFQ